MVTIFPIAENSHLIKDVGQIPHFFNQNHNYTSEVVSYKNSDDYFHARGEVHGIEMRHINDIGKTYFWEKAVVNYLRSEAQKIDVLNLYHLKKDTIVYGNLYKKLNPNGKLFIKMDAYNKDLSKGRVRYSTKMLKQFYFRQVEKKLFSNLDVISIESTEGLALLKNNYPELKHKIIYLPNGVNDVYLKSYFPLTKNYAEKENLILTVGRIGLEVKNNEMLLRIIPKLDLKDWKVVFIGPIHPPFLEKIENFYQDYPHLKSKVQFIGEVANREELYQYYNRSKLFCLTSPFESFGIAFVEAMYFGNYILGTTGMSAFKDLSKNFEYGQWTTVNDDSSYAGMIQHVIDDESLLKKKCEAIKLFIKTHFSWTNITANLYDKITSRIE